MEYLNVHFGIMAKLCHERSRSFVFIKHHQGKPLVNAISCQIVISQRRFIFFLERVIDSLINHH